MKVSLARSALALLLSLGSLPAFAGHRTDKPWALAVGFGDPAPSLFHGALAYQFGDLLQVRGGSGLLWWDEVRVHSFGASARVHILPTRFTPIFGGGLDLLVFRGSGSIQGLAETTLLGSLTAGVDFVWSDSVRSAAGFTFHFPLRLNFPFLEIGFMF